MLLQVALGPLIADSDLAVAGSTLAVAALFRPARARIQAAVSDTLQPTRVSLWRRGDPSRGPAVGRPG